MKGQILLKVEGLKVYYRGADRPAVDGLSLTVRAGECLAIVGESGSGKSTAASAIGRLTDLAGARCEGRILAGAGEAARDVLVMDTAALRAFRRDFVSYVFQEPASSLNPVMRVDEQFFEIFGRPDRLRVTGLLEDVKIRDAERVARSYPHELSGGMQQRVMIAMALAKQTKLLIADEPTTALDATVQREVLALLSELQRSKGLTIILVTHDLWAARETADRILVMRAGRAVEALGRGDYSRPTQAYTRALLSAALLEGEPKSRIPTGEAS
ncbi:MAG: ABC transporter ATP-binding protein [Candidatus Omnitrophica bacterium]|jgi:ABC-type dipeptide/oligopeptide/nickel transport system ATPase component|nr:ABC transporter ATP-binding protein [Candidatus Omnitrophota bacterium]